MGITLDLDRADQVLRRAVELAESDKPLPTEWLNRTGELETAAKTYTTVLGTALLAKATDPHVDPTSLKYSHSARAHSARRLATDVLTLAPQRYGFSLRTTGRDPFNNYPFRGPPSLHDIRPTAIGSADRPHFERLVAWITGIDDLDERDAFLGLAAFVRVRRAAAESAPTLDLRSVRLALDQLADVVGGFIRANPEDGKRGQALVAACFDLVFPRVETRKVYDPSRRAPGDVRVRDDDGLGIAAEVKQKPVLPDDVLAFAQHLRVSGLDRGFYCALAQDTALPRHDLVARSEAEWGVLLTIVESAGELLRASLAWSSAPLIESLGGFAEIMRRRLEDLEVHEATLHRWRRVAEQAFPNVETLGRSAGTTGSDRPGAASADQLSFD